MTCIEIDTPQSIMDQGNDYYEPGTDVFELIFTAAEGDFIYAETMIKALWSKWRRYMLGSCCTDRWVELMADRLDLIGHKWDDIFAAAIGTDLTGLTERSYERIVKREPIEGTEGDVRTTGYEHESLPQTQTTTTKYLDERSSGTDKYAPNTKDTETYAEDVDIPAATFARMTREFPDLLVGFADEFKDYFVDRWY